MSDAPKDPAAPAAGYNPTPISSPVARRGSGGIPIPLIAPTPLKSKLPRLPREFYQGTAAVLWTHTLEQHATGWLNDKLHRTFREILLHACSRYALATPCYVLMPDHWHLFWMGLSSDSDQHLATAFLRKNLRDTLGAAQLQDRAHDRVSRTTDQEAEALQNASSYVCNNPQRAGLTADWREWPYLGAMIAGYPDLDPRRDEFWPNFWKIHNRLVESNPDPCAPAQGYISTSKIARRGSDGVSTREGQ